MSLDVSVIIPAYNEEERLGPTLLAVYEWLINHGGGGEILVVDDGSTDGTVALVERVARSLAYQTRQRANVDSTARAEHVIAAAPTITAIPTRPNRGKGHAVRVGMLAARGRVRVMLDADGSVPPAQIPALLRPILAGEADIAIGSRRAAGASMEAKPPFYRRWWSRLSNRVVQWALVPGIHDTQCGFKAFSAAAAEEVFRRATIDGWAFDLEALALAHRLGLIVRELPVMWSDDPRSRIRPIRDAWNVFRELLTIRARLRRGAYGALGPAPVRAEARGVAA